MDQADKLRSIVNEKNEQNIAPNNSTNNSTDNSTNNSTNNSPNNSQSNPVTTRIIKNIPEPGTAPNPIHETPEPKQIKPLDLSARVITVSSGKGGVGKTNLSVNLAISFTRMGKSVLLLDVDFGLANIEVLLGVIPKFSLADVILGSKKIEEVITDGPMGIKFISGGSGLTELANLSDIQLAHLISGLSFLDTIADIVIIDTGAGISNTVIDFIRSSQEAIIVTTPEPTSITDAYALIKTIADPNQSVPSLKVIINRTDEAKEGLEVFEKLRKVSERFLGLHLIYLGAIPFDTALIKAVKRQQPATVLYPDSPFSKSIESISRRILDIETNKKSSGGIMMFVRKLMGNRK